MKQKKWEKIKQDLITAYDRNAPRRARAKKHAWKRQERKAFLAYLQSEKKRTFLEIGAGTGKDSIYFKKHGLKVFTTDVSPGNVAQCRKRGLRARVLDIYALSTLSKKYDAVYAMACLLHIPKKDFEGILKKIKRVLKPGGLLYVGLYGGMNWQGIYHEDCCRPKRFFSFFTTDRLLKIIQKYFKLEYFRHITPFKDSGTYQSMIARRA